MSVDFRAAESLPDLAVSTEMPESASPTRPTEIVVLVPSGRVRAWVVQLVEALRRQSALPVTTLRASWVARSGPAVPSEPFERILFGAVDSALADWVSTSALPSAEGRNWSETLLINATERDHRTFPPALRQSRILSPIFHGATAAEGLVRPLLSGEPPHLGVVLGTSETTHLLHAARFAAPERVVMRRALHLAFGRAITLVLGAVEHLLTDRQLPDPGPPVALQAHTGELEFWWRLAGAALPRLKRHLHKPFVRHDWWCVGLRPLLRDRPPTELDLNPESFQILDAGPDRFYADPFLLRHQGKTVLFLEDYDYRRQRAGISGVMIDEKGRAGAPFPALTAPYHLSYPYVFEHEGRAFMIPETSENRTIELYEAESFPGGWRQRAVLMEGVDASDTTVHFDRRSQLWWMFSAVSEFGSSSHDTLSLFFSERLEGPWRPHRDNPVKFGAANARPAGPLLPWGGRLFRPAQDCTHAYGQALVWCEIKRLTPDSFWEEPVARQQPGSGFTGLHTYCRAAGFEVIDLKRDRARGGSDGRAVASPTV